jgi:YidC/Oxa1 family membrane protein insertase
MMEKRAILAAVLMAALLMIYQTFFLPTAPESPPTAQPPAPTAPAAPAAPGVPAPAAPTPAPRVATPAPPRVGSEPRPPQRLATVETPLYSAIISSEGGKLQQLTLKYRGEKPLVVLGDLGPAGLVVASEPGQPGQPVAFDMPSTTLQLGPERPTGEIVLRGNYAGLTIQETLRFRHDTFTVDAAIRVENPTGSPRTVSLALPWTTRTGWKDNAEKFQGQHPTEIVWATNGNVARISDLTAVPERAMDGSWIGVGSVWYLAALLPDGEAFKLAMSSNGKATATPNAAEHVNVAVTASPTVAPGQTWEGRVVVYAGPKEYDRLAAHGLQGTIDFGGFPVPRNWGGLPMDWIGVPILRLMNWVYDHVGNYGIAIILLTVVSKILFYPLTVKSMRSMKAMQALAPQVNALRNKYKSDPQRLQRETLELYRKHKVNPAGGCLPMVAQIPIFYALYLALSVSVELQNAPFLCFGHVFGVNLWICDLASYDPTYVLPILMGVTMFVQQKMTPVAGDPRQAKMMLVMPFVFTFMFLNLPSGLVLYWTVSNVLQILQQWYMDRAKPKGAARQAKEAVRA